MCPPTGSLKRCLRGRGQDHQIPVIMAGHQCSSQAGRPPTSVAVHAMEASFEAQLRIAGKWCSSKGCADFPRSLTPVFRSWVAVTAVCNLTHLMCGVVCMLAVDLTRHQPRNVWDCLRSTAQGLLPRHLSDTIWIDSCLPQPWKLHDAAWG